MRVLVTGSRDWMDRHAVWDTLTELATTQGPFTLVHGGCPTGADAAADDWARFTKFPTEVFRADWRQHGRRAGPLRNERMVGAGADVALAFLRNGSRGTADTIERARQAGIEVQVREVNDG